MAEKKGPVQDVRNVTLEEKLDKLIEILQSIYTKYEYDDDKFRWTYDFLKSREAFNEL